MPKLRLALTASALAAALAACGTPSSTGPGTSIPVIGDSAFTVGPTLGQLTYATGINDSGTVVGVTVDLTNLQSGWQLKNGFLTYLTVPFPSSFNTAPQSVNDSGHVAGYYTLGNLYHAFYFDGTNYASFDYPAATATQAYGINAGGTIVGVYFPSGSGNGHAFKKVGGTFTNIDPPAITAAAALGINTLGDVVGEAIDGAGQHGYVWLHDAASPTEIVYAGVSQIIPYSINDSGTVVGSCVVSGKAYGFILQGTVLKLILYPGSSATEAYSINNAGVIVGEYSTTAPFGFELAKY